MDGSLDVPRQDAVTRRRRNSRNVISHTPITVKKRTETERALKGFMMRRKGVLALLAVSVGCHAGGSEKAVVVSDSAGITIVTNQGMDALTTDSLSRRLMDIGTTNGAPEYQFFRVSDGMILRDGRIAVLNAGTQQLRFYDAHGRFLSSQGERGKGPGEYAAPYQVMPFPGDSLLIYDIGLARFTVIDPSGQEARTFTPARPLLNAPQLAGLIGDSMAVTHETIFAIPDAGFDTMYTRVRFVPFDGMGTDSLVLPDSRMGHIGPGRQGFVGSPLFEPRASFATDGHGLWAGLARTPEVSRYDAHGRLERLVRWRAPRVPITKGDIERAMNQIMADAGGRAGELKKWYQDVPVASVFPFYDRLYVDRQLHLWVRTYDVTGAAVARLWVVFDPDGRAVGRVKLPATLRVLEVDGDSLLAVQANDMGVEHVQLWRLDHRIEGH
jgi:hypothetical protein